jgi:hypothetical protein
LVVVSVLADWRGNWVGDVSVFALGERHGNRFLSAAIALIERELVRFIDRNFARMLL